MYQTRRIESSRDWSDPDGIKIYTISAHDRSVDRTGYLARLVEVKKTRTLDWASTPAFVIFHDGANAAYLVLAWWANDNELFTSVSVETASGWVEDPARFSFCLWDLEIFWHERGFFVDCICCMRPSLHAYRQRRFDRGRDRL